MREIASWPVVPRAGDPAAREPVGDDALPADLGWSNFARCRGRLPRDEYRLHAERFLELVARLRRGEPAPDLASLAAILLLDHRLLPECRAMPEVVAEPAPVEDLVRVATDHCPDAATEASDWAFGPWAEILDPNVALERRALEVALAWHAATERDGARTTVERWAGDREVPPPGVRARIRAVATAPLGLWAVRGQDGERVLVEDLLGLGPRWQWSASVPIQVPGGVAGPIRVGGAVLARPVSTPGGWWLASPIALPLVPPAERVLAWVHREILVARLAARGMRREIFLARRGTALSRSIHEWLWSAV